MPFFTLQIVPQGAIVAAVIGVSHARRDALIAEKLPVPDPLKINALVDTGASGTCVDPSVLEKLSLSATGQVSVNTPSTGAKPHTADQYDVSIWVPGALPTHPPLALPNMPVIAAEILQQQGFHALIGRDVLSRCLLTYNGLQGTFTVAY